MSRVIFQTNWNTSFYVVFQSIRGNMGDFPIQGGWSKQI